MTGVVNEVFGKVLIASEIEEAITNLLQKWFPTYLAEIARQLGQNRNIFPAPQNYTNRNSFDAEAGEKIPKVVVISPGLATGPVRRQMGAYHATWRLGVGVATGAKDEQSANMKVKVYGGAVRAILPQQQGDTGIPGLTQITWINELYEDMNIPNQHQLYKAASLLFSVEVEGVVDQHKGPTAPTIDAPPDWPTVQDVIIDMEGMNGN